MDVQNEGEINRSKQFAEMGLWFDTFLGKALLESEANMLKNLLPRRFGYHLLQIGCANLAMFESSPIGHKFAISIDGSALGHKLIATGESLPFANESIDLVLLHHALDYTKNQHQLLREVSRVLIEGGDVVIVGFNPFSSWGLRKALQWPKVTPWQSQLLSTRRLTDWLKLLEFQVEKINYDLYALPFNSPAVIKYSSAFNKLAARFNWPTGGVYTISAKKQVIPMTPVKQPWRKLRSSSIAMPIPKQAKQSTHIKSSQQEPQ